eukprot:2945329-Prymnesium_polylepis.1
MPTPSPFTPPQSPPSPGAPVAACPSSTSPPPLSPLLSRGASVSASVGSECRECGAGGVRSGDFHLRRTKDMPVRSCAPVARRRSLALAGLREKLRQLRRAASGRNLLFGMPQVTPVTPTQVAIDAHALSLPLAPPLDAHLQEPHCFPSEPTRSTLSLLCWPPSRKRVPQRTVIRLHAVYCGIVRELTSTCWPVLMYSMAMWPSTIVTTWTVLDFVTPTSKYMYALRRAAARYGCIRKRGRRTHARVTAARPSLTTHRTQWAPHPTSDVPRPSVGGPRACDDDRCQQWKLEQQSRGLARHTARMAVGTLGLGPGSCDQWQPRTAVQVAGPQGKGAIAVSLSLMWHDYDCSVRYRVLETAPPEPASQFLSQFLIYIYKTRVRLIGGP